MNPENDLTPMNISRKHLIYPVLALALVIRFLHLAAAVNNPMTYYPGADEAYYLGFAKDVSHGQFGLSTLYIFMDPLYGYLLGLFNWIAGQNIFAIYLFQIFVDVFTVAVIYKIGNELWDHRAGVIAAVFYALSSTAIFYTTTSLKPTLVANYVALWVLLSYTVPQTKYPAAWLGYGIFTGMGVALRANLLLLSLAGFFILPLLHRRNYGRNNLWIKMVLLLIGFSLPVIMLVARNEYVSNQWSILPPNSGIVLHQLYNPDNPESTLSTPDFVAYSTPPELLSGYTKEAEKLTGRQLSIFQVDDFWRNQAVRYIKSHPARIVGNILHKSKQFIAYNEIDNNRFLKQEAGFSPLLTVLPQPFGWLFALGLPGLILLFLRNKLLSLPVIIAAITVFVTFVVFIAAARFRAHGLPLFAVGSGAFISAVIDWGKTGKTQVVVAIAVAIILGSLTFLCGNQTSSQDSAPMEFAWGYLKMGKPGRARQYALRKIRRSPGDAGPYELLGYMALGEKQYEKATLILTYATQLAPQHHVTQYNLALGLRQTNQLNKSLTAIDTALSRAVLPDYLFLKAEILEQLGDKKHARSTYKYLLETAGPGAAWQEYAEKAKKRLYAPED